MLLFLSKAEEVAVVDAPLLQRLVLWKISTSYDTDDELPVKIRLACAPELQVLGYLEPRAHQLQIGETIIKVYYILLR